MASQDSGRQWNPISSPASNGDLYDVAIGAKGVLLAATAKGAFRSADYGLSWSQITGGLAAGTVRTVAFDSTRLRAVAAQHGIVYQSNDAGVTWTPVDMSGLEGASIRSLIVPEAAPDQLFALTRGRGVFVSPLTQITAASRKGGLNNK
jgi:photosystem II stability/assembly factor-like uncharacterized protein